jgi:hypothetical protein
MQGKGLIASGYWPYMYTMISERNPKARKVLARYSPDKLLLWAAETGRTQFENPKQIIPR